MTSTTNRVNRSYRSGRLPNNNLTNTTLAMNHKPVVITLISLIIAASQSFAAESHKSGPFQGAKANTGFVTHTTDGGKSILTLSDDFVAPQTPDPHWQVVDSKGNTYLL